MEQAHVIRHKHYSEGQSVRRIAREMGLHRWTVRKYLEESVPQRVEVAPRGRPVMGAIRQKIDGLLKEWAHRTTKKQRITSPRLHRELIAQGCSVGERTVRKYLAEKRRVAAEVYIPLVHRPGDEAQVDFFEVTVELNGVMTKVWKFLLRLMYSKRDLVWLYERCNQVSFFDGHVRAFTAMGGVPHRLIYDNLSAAVKRIMGLSERELNDRFKALNSHYLYESCFARPGEGHDKGGVEGRGKTIRLQHLTPIVSGKTLSEISIGLQVALDNAHGQAKNHDGRSYGELFDQEQWQMRPLPAQAFDPRLAQPVCVSRSATVTLLGAVYSTPTAWARLDAMAYIGVEDIRFVCRGDEHIHPLQPKGGKSIRYRHYLPELARKPQAVRQVAPELLAELGEPFGQLWDMLEKTHGQLKAARILAGVLGAINDHGEALISRAIINALAEGRGRGDKEPMAEGVVLKVLSGCLPARPVLGAERVPAALRFYEIQSGCAADYDQLLAGGVQ